MTIGSRTMIIGCGGAGKSTLALKLHHITKIELIHLDQYYWKPNWVELEREAWVQKVEDISNKEAWIVDGNYISTMDIRMQRADTIIFLDRSRWTCIMRVFKRYLVNYGKSRVDMADGCKERLDLDFLNYIYKYNESRRPKIIDKLENLKDSKEIYYLCSDNEVEQFLDSVRKSFGCL